MKIDGLLRVVNFVKMGGVIEESLFVIEKQTCNVLAMDASNDVLVRVKAPVDLPAIGELPLANLSYFVKLYECFKGMDVEVNKIEEDTKLLVAPTSKEGLFFLLAEKKHIRTTVETPEMVDGILKAITMTVDLLEETRDRCKQLLSVIASENIFFMIEKDGCIVLHAGGEQETGFDIEVGKGKTQKKEWSFPVNKERLLAILDVLEYPQPPKEKEGEETKGKLKRTPKVVIPQLNLVNDPEHPDQPLAVFTQPDAVWVLSAIR